MPPSPSPHPPRSRTDHLLHPPAHELVPKVLRVLQTNLPSGLRVERSFPATPLYPADIDGSRLPPLASSVAASGDSSNLAVSLAEASLSFLDTLACSSAPLSKLLPSPRGALDDLHPVFSRSLVRDFLAPVARCLGAVFPRHVFRCGPDFVAEAERARPGQRADVVVATVRDDRLEAWVLCKDDNLEQQYETLANSSTMPVFRAKRQLQAQVSAVRSEWEEDVKEDVVVVAVEEDGSERPVTEGEKLALQIHSLLSSKRAAASLSEADFSPSLLPLFSVLVISPSHWFLAAGLSHRNKGHLVVSPLYRHEQRETPSLRAVVFGMAAVGMLDSPIKVEDPTARRRKELEEKEEMITPTYTSPPLHYRPIVPPTSSALTLPSVLQLHLDRPYPGSRSLAYPSTCDRFVVKLVEPSQADELPEAENEAARYHALGAEGEREGALVPFLGLWQEEHSGRLAVITAKGEKVDRVDLVSFDPFASLAFLHRHSLTHGDARLANFVTYGRSLRLIDLGRTRSASKSSCERERQEWDELVGPETRWEEQRARRWAVVQEGAEGRFTNV
ncbi:hypothetical protein JCM8097_007688 [Rhodosporidiobolus ruineniae]